MKSPRPGSQLHTHCVIDVITATVTAKGGRCWAWKEECVKVREEDLSRRSGLGLWSSYKGSASQASLILCASCRPTVCTLWAHSCVSRCLNLVWLRGLKAVWGRVSELAWCPSVLDSFYGSLSLHFPNSSCAPFGRMGDTKELLWYLRMAVAREGGDEKLAGADMGLPCRGGELRFTQCVYGHKVSGKVQTKSRPALRPRWPKGWYDVLQFSHLYNRETMVLTSQYGHEN